MQLHSRKAAKPSLGAEDIQLYQGHSPQRASVLLQRHAILQGDHSQRSRYIQRDVCEIQRDQGTALLQDECQQHYQRYVL